MKVEKKCPHQIRQRKVGESLVRNAKHRLSYDIGLCGVTTFGPSLKTPQVLFW